MVEIFSIVVIVGLTVMLVYDMFGKID